MFHKKLNKPAFCLEYKCFSCNNFVYIDPKLAESADMDIGDAVSVQMEDISPNWDFFWSAR